jgi:hypothetical protein
MPRNLWRGYLVALLCIGLVRPAKAENFDTLGHQIIAGIVLVSAAVVVGLCRLGKPDRRKSVVRDFGVCPP